MIMSWIFCIFAGLSCLCALLSGNGSPLAAAIPEGAQAGITLAMAMAGSLCLWSGVGKLMEYCGITDQLSRFLRPVLIRIFPGCKADPLLARYLSGNVCANFLGLGNAATPLGIQAVRQMAHHAPEGIASDEMCRLVVLNTASIQLIPATVAALRASLGCSTPFDLLPAVWISSLSSTGAGLLAALVLGKIWAHD